MALLGGELLKGFGCQTGVALQKRITVLFHLFYALLTVADSFKALYGEGAAYETLYAAGCR